MEKIKCLLFNLSSANLVAHEEFKEKVMSGCNILTEIIRFENGKFVDSPFVQQMEIPTRDEYNLIKNEDMSNILGIDDHNLLYYEFFKQRFMSSTSGTLGNLMGGSGFKILLDKLMFKGERYVYEIRFRYRENWTSWQAIAGKFIVLQEYGFGPGGIAEVYSSMSAKEVEAFKDDFQIRYCGCLIEEMVLSDSLQRIYNDPCNSDIRKIIDPSTYQILFDSQLIQEFSGEDISKIWFDFENRYR